MAKKKNKKTLDVLQTQPQTTLIQLSTEPSEAAVYLDGSRIGTTPHEVQLLPDQQITVTVQKRGHEPREILLSPLTPKPHIILPKRKKKKNNPN